MNLSEMGEFKNLVVSKFVNDENIVDVLLGDTSDYDDVETALLGDGETGQDGRIYKFEYVPDTQEKAKTFLCVEVVPQKTEGDTVTSMYVYVFCYCSKNIMQTYHRAGTAGTRVDILANDVDKILNGNTEFGIGPLVWRTSSIYKPAQFYYGRMLVYTVSAFRRSRL